MRRRTYLATVGAAIAGGLSGCAGADGDTPADPGDTSDPETADHSGEHSESPTEDAPDGVYVPDHTTEMTMEGMDTEGDFQFSVMLSSPEVFYFVEGTDVVQSEDLDQLNVHVMASVWDPETGTVLPETGLSVEVLTPDEETVTQEVIYPMLSQRMGFHFGSNVALPEDGEYIVRASVGGVSIERTRGFAGRFDSPASVDIPVSFTESKREQFTESDPENAGESAALSPMSMGELPTGSLPAPADMPGTVIGEAVSDDATLVGGVVTDGFGGDRPYLYVSPRTPYNRFPLPSMSIETAVEGVGSEEPRRLERRLDPEVGYHYGTGVPEEVAEALSAGETELTIDPTLPPQVTRHAGYETAFIEMDPVTVSR